jgi:hypothetical protein
MPRERLLLFFRMGCGHASRLAGLGTNLPVDAALREIAIAPQSGIRYPRYLRAHKQDGGLRFGDGGKRPIAEIR